MRKLLTVLLVASAPAGVALAAERITAPSMPMRVLSAPACATAAPLVLGSTRHLPREAGARRHAEPPAADVLPEEEDEATLRPAFQLCVPPQGAARPAYRT